MEARVLQKYVREMKIGGSKNNSSTAVVAGLLAVLTGSLATSTVVLKSQKNIAMAITLLFCAKQ